jgi:hypothetical protein
VAVAAAVAAAVAVRPLPRLSSRRLRSRRRRWT